MTPLSVFEFDGIDRRRAAGLASQSAAHVARNLVLNSAKVWRTRPGTRRVYACPPQSRGLYSGAGVLRTVIPSFVPSAAAFQRPELWLDQIEGPEPIDRFVDAVIYGPPVAIGALPYLAVQRNGQMQHHWCTSRPMSIGDPVQTRVATQFEPRANLLRMAGRLFAIASAANDVRFSSVEFGPADWETLGDAGFLPVRNNATGDASPVWLSHFRDRMVVLFDSQIQVWHVDPDPAEMALVDTLNGPGTQEGPLTQNVIGDLLFFSRGGFRSLTTQAITGEIREGDIGAPIVDLTDGMAGGVASVWWQRQGVYLAAIGGRVFVFIYNPSSKVTGWSEWAFPFPVEHFAVVSNELYIRSGDDVYHVSDQYDTDDGLPIEWEWQSQHFHARSPGVLKSFKALTLNQRGQSEVLIAPDFNEPNLVVPVGAAANNTLSWGKIPMNVLSEAAALVLRGTGRWKLDGITLHYDPLGV